MLTTRPGGTELLETGGSDDDADKEDVWVDGVNAGTGADDGRGTGAGAALKGEVPKADGVAAGKPNDRVSAG